MYAASVDERLKGLGGRIINPALLSELQEFAPEMDLIQNTELDRLVLVQDRRKCEHPEPFRPIWIEDDRLLGCPAAHFAGDMTPFEYVYMFDHRGQKIVATMDAVKRILRTKTRWGGERGREAREQARAKEERRQAGFDRQDADFKAYLRTGIADSYKKKREVVLLDGFGNAVKAS